MNIDIQISKIQIEDNNVNSGQTNPQFTMEFNPHIKSDSLISLKIRWTIQMNINPKEYCIHRSITEFVSNSFPLSGKIWEDPRIDLLSELAQISQSHTRALFVYLNNTENIPLFEWKDHLKDEISLKMKSLLN